MMKKYSDIIEVDTSTTQMYFCTSCKRYVTVEEFNFSLKMCNQCIKDKENDKHNSHPNPKS